VDGEVHLAGHLDETGNFVEYFEASDALKDVTGRGLFELEREGLFTSLMHAPTIMALADHIEAEWSDSVLHEETIKRAAELMGGPGEGVGGHREIVLREFVSIARLRTIIANSH
jgi:hypothetical protein